MPCYSTVEVLYAAAAGNSFRLSAARLIVPTCDSFDCSLRSKQLESVE